MTIPFLVITTNTVCNLKCKDCGNFVPYIEQKLYDIDTIIYDLKIILNSISAIEILQIQGGECFLHPHLAELISFAIEEDKIINLHIATNGYAKISNTMIALLKHPKITVRISNYNDIIDQSPIINLFKENSIRFFTYTFTQNKKEWLLLGNRDFTEEKNTEIVNNRYNNCPFKACFTLENRLIGRCSRSIIAKNIFNINNLSSYLDLSNNALTSNEIINYFKTLSPMDVCKYCYGGDAIAILPAIQIKQKESDYE